MPKLNRLAANGINAETFFRKKRVTVIVTDSGLGGLSIFAQLEKTFRRQKIFENIELIYFNAWPEQDRGYHKLRDLAERTRVFDQALKGMQSYDPDLIMIACNTLSVLYPKTLFSREAPIPVVGIVDLGVDLIYESLMSVPESRVILLGTLTVVEVGTHEHKIIQKGVAPERIITQACPGLPTEIQKDPDGKTVMDLIERYVHEASIKVVEKKTPIFAALCCTHFSYCQELFKKNIEKYFSNHLGILDPNSRMSDLPIKSDNIPGRLNTNVNAHVVSKVVIDPMQQKALSRHLEDISKPAVRALFDYEYKPDLF